jgi:hypothetical protein
LSKISIAARAFRHEPGRVSFRRACIRGLRALNTVIEFRLNDSANDADRRRRTRLPFLNIDRRGAASRERPITCF